MIHDEPTLFFTQYDSPLGPIGLAATRRGLASLMLRVELDAYALHLENVCNGKIETDDRPFSKVRLFLDRYFSGKRIEFDGPFDLLEGTRFQRQVWATLLTIPYGEVRSYRWLARTIGNPSAHRAVGLANGQNPISILIPCHRVVNQNGALGGYTGGLDIKRYLLALERVQLPALASLPMAGFESSYTA